MQASFSVLELLAAAVASGQTLDGLLHVGLSMTILFPTPSSVLKAAEVTELLQASAPSHADPDATAEMLRLVLEWGDPEATGHITREGWLRLTERLEELTQALVAEGAAATVGGSPEGVYYSASGSSSVTASPGTASPANSGAASSALAHG